MSKSLRLAWLQRIDNAARDPWKWYLLTKFGGLFLFNCSYDVTAPSNNMHTLKFKAQPTKSFFTTVNQVFGGSSQPPTTAERAVMTR